MQLTKRTVELVKKTLKKAKKDLKLETWEIRLDVYYDPRESSFHTSPGTRAILDTALPEYESAKIEVFLKKIKNKHELYDIIRHELLHITLSPLSTWWEEVTKNVLSLDTLKQRFFREELVIRQLEKLLGVYKNG